MRKSLFGLQTDAHRESLRKDGFENIRKFLFVDIDGVLNHSKSKDAIDSECLRNLSQIIKKTDACIILISSWRHGWSKDEKEFNEMAQGLIEAAVDPDIGDGPVYVMTVYAEGREPTELYGVPPKTILKECFERYLPKEMVDRIVGVFCFECE